MSRKILSRILIAGLALTAAWLSTELAARSWLAAHTLRPIDDMARSAYADPSFYSDQFLVEMHAFSGAWFPNSAGLNVAPNVRGRFLNTDADGYRVTSAQPIKATNTVYVFGSSITFGMHLPDWYALSSQLQRHLPGYRVVSQAALGSTEDAQLNRLRQLDLRAGDLVLWFGGYTASEAGFLDARYRYRDQWPDFVLRGRWSVFQAIQQGVAQDTPPELLSAVTRQERIAELAEHVEVVIAAAGQISADRGAYFYSFVEPSLVFKPMTGREALLWAGQKAGETTYLSEAWSALGTVPGQIDLSHLFADERGEMFLDCCHLNDAATVRMAEVVVAYLSPPAEASATTAPLQTP